MFFKIIYVILPAEYSWLESYLSNDSLWFEDSLNWDEVFDLILSDITVYSFLVTPFFYNSHFFIDSLVKLSFLDVMFLIETNKNAYSKELYDFFIWDLFSLVYNKFLPFQFLFYTDYQDFLVTVLYYSPELMFAIIDYVNIYWSSSTTDYNTASVFDLYSDTLNSVISEFVEYFIVFFFFLWMVVLFISVFHLFKWDNSLEVYFSRIYYYVFSLSKEMRIQFETMLSIFFFFFFIELWW